MIAETTPPAEPGTSARTFGLDVVITTGGKVLFVLCGALMTVLIARYLGPRGQGTFAVAYSLTLLLVQVGSVGLSIANPFFAARDKGAQRAIAMHSLWLAAVVATGLALSVAGVKALAPDVLRGLDWLETAITLGALPAALATLYLQGVILGQQRMPWFSLVEVAQIASSLIVLGVLFLVAAPSLAIVLLVVAGGRYVALGVALWALRDVLRRPANPRPGLVRRMLTHAARVYVVSLLSFALIRLDLLLVNGLLTPADAGQYSIAAYIAEALIVIPSMVATNLLPRISRTDDATLTANVMRVVGVVWGGICAVSVPAAIISIPLLFGHRYNQAVELYLWLAPGTFFLGLISALMVHYWVRGYPRSLIVAWIMALALNVIGNAVLLPVWGVAVAPIVSTVTYAGVLAVHAAVFAREAGGFAALRPAPRETVRVLRTMLRRG